MYFFRIKSGFQSLGQIRIEITQKNNGKTDTEEGNV